MAARIPGPRLLVEPFAVTIAAQIATLPVMAGTFGVIALAGPVANALVLPLLPLMIVVGGLGATLSALHPALAGCCCNSPAPTSITTTVARRVSAIPGAAIEIGSWPAAWSAAEGVGVVAALVVLVIATRGAEPRRV